MTLLLSLLLIAGTWGLGSLVLAALVRLDRPRRCAGGQASRADAALAAALGVVALSLAAFVLASVGQLRPLPLGLLLLVGVVGAVSGVRRIVNRNVESSSFVAGASPPESAAGSWRIAGYEWALLAVMAAHGLGNLARALAPPTAWDAVAYHLALARLYSGAGGFIDLATIRQSHWPLGIDLLFAVGESLGGSALAGIVGWLLGVLLLIVTGTAAAYVGGPRAGVLAAALLAGAPAVAFLQGMAYVECGLAALIAGSLLAVLRYGSEFRRSDAVAAGLLAGAAASVKYTALVIPALAALALLVVSRRWQPALGLLAAAGAVALPWYARTFALTGNPVWPYAFDWFGGRGWDLEHAGRLAAFERGYGPGRGLPGLFVAPFEVTFFPQRFDRLQLGPAFLALFPLIFCSLDRKRWALLAFATGGYFAWTAATWQIRFLVPVLPAVSVAIALGVTATAWKWSGRFARLLTLLVLVSTLSFLVPSLRDRLPVLFGWEPREQYLSRNLSSFPAIDFVNRELKPRKVLLFRELRGYWLDVPYLWGDPLNQTVIDYAKLSTSSELAARLAELGVDSVLIDASAYPENESYYDRRTLALMDEMLQAGADRVFHQGDLSVWRLRPGP